MTSPLISVVVASYNSADFLAECLACVLDQSWPRIEVIVVDDGSTDSTRDIVARFGNKVHYAYQDNSGGPASPRNHGSELATGELITFIDADDRMLAGKLRAQAEALEKHPEIACVVTDYRNFTAEGPSSITHFDTCDQLRVALSFKGAEPFGVLDGKRARTILISENFNSAGAPMFRRQFFRELGGFDASLTASEDYDLFYRSAMRAPVGVLRRVGYERRLHDANMTLHAGHMLTMQSRCRNKLAQLEPDPSLRQQLRMVAASYQLALAEELGRRGQGLRALRALVSSRARPALRSRQALHAAAWCVYGPLSSRGNTRQ